MTARAIILGRVGFKEVKQTKNGNAMCKLSIATDRRWKDSSDNKCKETYWHSVTFFDKMADIADKYTEVGNQVYIEGNIQHKKVEDGGISKYYYSVMGTNIELLPNKKDDEEGDNSKGASFKTPTPAEDSHFDDVPF